MTNGEINRLGKRLREAATVSPEDLALLQQLREAHDDALAEVARILREELGLEPTTRLKTVNTLVDKVRREHMKLAEVQDIAGARITLASAETRIEQDHLTAKLLARFPGSKLIDRRVRPTFGYRAVHVVVRANDCRIEIQVRTLVQHSWAQSVEYIADSWGRQIRYGGDPELPDRVGRSGETRRAALAALLSLAEVSEEFERLEVALFTLTPRVERFRLSAHQVMDRPAPTEEQAEFQRLTEEIGGLTARMGTLRREAEHLTARVRAVLAAEGEGDE